MVDMLHSPDYFTLLFFVHMRLNLFPGSFTGVLSKISHFLCLTGLCHELHYRVFFALSSENLAGFDSFLSASTSHSSWNLLTRTAFQSSCRSYRLNVPPLWYSRLLRCFFSGPSTHVFLQVPHLFHAGIVHKVDCALFLLVSIHLILLFLCHYGY